MHRSAAMLEFMKWQRRYFEISAKRPVAIIGS